MRGRRQRQVVLGAVALDQLVLGDPVDLAARPCRGRHCRRPAACAPRGRARALRSRRRRGAATKSRALAKYSSWISSALASRPLASFTLRRPVMSWQTSRIARIGVLQSEVAHDDAGFDHAQDEVRRTDLQQRRRLGHVGVADDDVQPAEALGVGVRLVAGVDDRAAAGGRAAHALPDVLGALADAVDRAARGLQHLAGAADDLPGDEERDQYVGEAGELAVPADEVVLVAAVGVAGASRCCS